LTSDFTALGASADDAQQVVARVSGAQVGRGSGSTAFDQLPAAVQQQFLQAVHQGYADAVSWAFVGAAVAMLVVAALGLCYPKGVVSAAFADPAPTDDHVADDRTWPTLAS
jgi:hypothetical protein